MIAKALLALLSLSLTLTAGTDPSQWEVTSVPGLDQPVNFKHYSGFVDAGEGRRLHYWFMESQRSPSEDPVLLWLNGGPCCSSLVGAIAELGPFRVGYQGINMTTNPSSWNKVANIIFLESPAGVGFSYERSGNYASDDTQTTDQNYLATLNFFDEYPMFKKNDFYIAGESYAGVYVPLLAQRFVKDPRGINLKGYAVGNGALDMELLGKSIMFFGYYHGLFGQRLWKELTTNCCNGSISQETCDFGWSTKNPACIDPVKRANQIILSSGLNVYNLYDPCNYDQGSWSLAPRYSDSTMQHAFRRLVKKLFKWPTTNINVTKPKCIDQDRLQLYFNRRDVIEALHVQESPLQWYPCNMAINYTEQHTTMREVVQDLATSGQLRALIYNGDVDMACNFLGDDWFVHSLGYEPTSEYRMWHVDGVISGFVQNFEHNITFVTLKGSGHMVPLDKAAESLHMITNFLSGTPFL
ncbi:lysosomal protective protein-like isoform X2 [Rhipicephalus microplus]|uniref:lysosomal protective protein-like isoform X2 n=1 Tax=Rhipicephalus microplus TaxID=6941 RepID=UPI003F6BC92B